MDVKQLPATIILLIAIGMLLGTGVLILANFGDATRDQASVVGERVNLTVANSSVTLTYDEWVTTVTPTVTNTSGTTLSSTAYTLDYTAGTITRTGASNALDYMYNVSYTYTIDIDATTAMDNINTSLGTISSTWIGLIVTMLALAIILGMVLKSFSGGR